MRELKFMKQLSTSFFLVVMSLLGATEALNAQQPVKVLSGNILSDRTLVKDTIYDLDGFVYVKNNATLSIQAGTTLRGYIHSSGYNTKGSLIITRDAAIQAIGTECEPIVFTSAKASGSKAAGDWGGLYIFGEAILNRGIDQGTYFEEVMEGGLSGDVNDRMFGGASSNDNSGTLQYVRLEYSGADLGINSEANALTLAGVGSGTTIDHIFVSYANDDAFEIIGGSVDLSYVVALASKDDNFDCDYGYNGNVQFGIIYQEASTADISKSEGWETENASIDPNLTPRTAPIFSHFTVIGPKATGTPDAQHQSVARIRRGSWTSIHNSIFVDHVNGIFIDGDDSYAGWNAGNMQMTGNILAGMTNDFKASGSHTASDIAALYDAPSNSNTRYPSTASVLLSSDYNQISNPNLVPQSTSPALSGATYSFTGASNFANVNYRGAMGSTDWTSGWGEWDPQNPTNNYNGPVINSVSLVSAPKSFNVSFSTSGGDLFVLQTRVAGSTTWKTPKSWTNTSLTSQNFTADLPGGVNEVRIGARNAGVWAYSCETQFTAPCKPMTVSAIELVDAFCEGDSALLKAIANGGYRSKTFLWNTGATTRFIYGQQGQTYSVRITDEAGCVDSASVTVGIINTAYSPRSFSVVKPNAVTFTGSWTAPTFGTGVSLIGYRMAYRQVGVGASWTTTPLSSNTTATVDFTGSGNPTANYEFTAFARVNDNGSIYNTEYACTARRFYNGSGNKTDVVPNSELGELAWNIYPNPTQDWITIEWNREQNIHIRLMDLTGRIILERESISSTSEKIDLGNLSVGAYLLEISLDGRIIQERIMRQ